MQIMSHGLGLLLLACLAARVSGGSEWHNDNCADNRATMVHLFEWKWTDIAAECERFLGPMGFCGVQVSPPNEHILIEKPFRPWWQRYQPVSYKLESRSGTEAEFIDMVQRCNNVNVRIYVDAIINHMTGVGQRGIGSGGTEFDADEGHFPGVPYSMADFHGCDGCDGCCCVNSWTNLDMVRVCRLSGLIDLNQKIEYVQDMIAGNLNRLLDIGVAGFRIDAAKHMYPEDIEKVWAKVNNVNPAFFPNGGKPFMFLEVIDLAQHQEVRAQWYTHLGRVTEFRFCIKVKNAQGGLWDVFNLFDQGWGMVDPGDAFVFVDNHDNQRGHGGGGDILTHKDRHKYQMAQTIAMAQDYGHVRIMSSYDFESGDDSPPLYEDGSTKPVPILDDGSCGDGWICEHRWKPITGMAGFAKAVKGTVMENKFSNGNEVAFSRGNNGFFAITNNGGMDQTLYTGLPAGQYCNVIQGCPTSSGCEGDTINVGGDGYAHIKITDGANPILAIHIEAMSGSDGCIWNDPGVTPGPTPQPPTTGAPATTTPRPTGTPGPTTAPPAGYAKTVIFFRAQTNPGQDVFLRGGIGHDYRPGCNDDAATSPCAINIEHNSLGSSSHYDGYNAWRVGDKHLDWYGAEEGQGDFNGYRAEGSPSAWTTNDPSNAAYQELNQWGDHYWMMEVMMDCSGTENGWFEMKGLITGGWGWENDLTQDASCSGTAGGSTPYITNNHMGRCGFINVFHVNEGRCTINNF